jgi:hypothetical protein
VLRINLGVKPDTDEKGQHSLQVFATKWLCIDISELQCRFGIHQFNDAGHILFVKPRYLCGELAGVVMNTGGFNSADSTLTVF